MSEKWYIRTITDRILYVRKHERLNYISILKRNEKEKKENENENEKQPRDDRLFVCNNVTDNWLLSQCKWKKHQRKINFSCLQKINNINSGFNVENDPIYSNQTFFHSIETQNGENRLEKKARGGREKGVEVRKTFTLATNWTNHFMKCQGEGCKVKILNTCRHQSFFSFKTCIYVL